eukprot:TRINITY_DN16423_c0_g1_i1.p1 TRINITY_DN16423_c0_g1~~TRINITY_DN16423_c0_g1_i1.p1  ORF type:complete len:221 (+),score=53.00 TRINITY_DN16423_c0_g1_i1:141-803(+)
MWNSHMLLCELRDQLPAHVIVFEYPGYGIAGGHASDQACNDALSAVYRWVTRNQAVPCSDVIFCGRSIGTGPCAWLAAKLHEEDLGGLVMISAFSSVKAVVRNATADGGRMMEAAGSAAQYLIQDRYKNAKELTAVRCPVLLLHGTEDNVCSPEDAEKLYEACTSTAHRQLCLIPGMDHDNILDFTDELREQLSRVFDCKAKPGRKLERNADYSIPEDNE